MFIAHSENTTRGILARNGGLTREQRARLIIQRAAYEAKRAEAEHIANIRRVAAERAEAMKAEMAAMGYQYRPTYSEIERRACSLFKVTKAEIRSNRRNRNVVFVRQFIAYWSTRLTNLSLPQIGRLMGGKDHTTILHGRNAYPVKRERMGRYLRRTA